MNAMTRELHAQEYIDVTNTIWHEALAVKLRPWHVGYPYDVGA